VLLRLSGGPCKLSQTIRKHPPGWEDSQITPTPMKIALSRRRLTVGCLAFLSIAVTNLHADLLYYAGFDDAPGPGTPSGWTDTENGNETDGFYTLGHGISAGSLTYPNLLTTGNKWVLGVNSATGSGAPATPLG